MEYFVAGATARCAADLVGVNCKIVTFYFHQLWEIIAEEESSEGMDFGEVDESVGGSYNVLDGYEFKHFRINHSKLFAGKLNLIAHINCDWLLFDKR